MNSKPVILPFDLKKRGSPLYTVPLAYIAIALVFPDRWMYVRGLIMAVVLFLGSYGLGKQLSFFLFKTAEQKIYAILGLGFALAASYVVFLFSIKLWILYCIWGALAVLSIAEFPILTYRFPRSYGWAAPFLLLAFWSSFTPTTFFDALVYHIGLPSQYLLAGKFSIFTNHLYSSFPPFDQVLNLLFIGLNAESGIKVFSTVMYLLVVTILTGLLRALYFGPQRKGGNGRDRDASDTLGFIRSEFLLFIALLIPSAWIQIHIITGEMLVTLFFCAGVVTLVKEYDDLTPRKMITIALLLAWSIWTKWNALVYVGFVGVLWLILLRGQWKSLGLLYGLIFLFVLPLLARNFLAFGDPLYPSLSGIFSTPYWGSRQSMAIELDSFAGGYQRMSEIFLAPLRLTFQPGYYGSASPIGLLPLTALLVYPFAKKFRRVNQILLYVLICYLLWLFTFHNFRQFFPPFVLLFLMFYLSLQWINAKIPRYMPGYWALCSLACAFFLLPIYRIYFPLISFQQTRADYLRHNLDYFSSAEAIQKDREAGTILLLGQTRIAYFNTAVIGATAYDQHPLLKYLEQARSSDDLFAIFRTNNIRFIFMNLTEWGKDYKKYGLLPVELIPDDLHQAFKIQAETRALSGAVPLKMSEDKLSLWREFLSRFCVRTLRSGDSIFVYKISSSAESSSWSGSAEPGSTSNQCVITIRQEPRGVRIVLTNGNPTLDFEHFQLKVNEGEWKNAPAQFLMLDKFEKLACRSVDRNGLFGQETSWTPQP
jgi:hypothetical protein